MMDIQLWMLPNHMKPSQSIKGLKKGRFERSRSFRDRIYLTDVGDALWRAASDRHRDSAFLLVSHKDYLMTRAEIRSPSMLVVIEGHKMGMSSWTSAFRVSLSGDDRLVTTYLDDVVGRLGRVPSSSPYWGPGEWDTIRRVHAVGPQELAIPWKQVLPNRPQGGA